MDEYDALLHENAVVKFGTRNVLLQDHWDAAAQMKGSVHPRLYMKQIREFHREYEWAT